MPVFPDPLSRFAFACSVAAGQEGALQSVGAAAGWAETGPAARTWTPWTDEEVAELEAFNSWAGNGYGAPMAKLLSKGDTLAVLTGQQPNLLASPLYILHKALSACAWARSLERIKKHRVIPVFWVASDDHDFNELRDCWLLKTTGELSNIGATVSRGARVPAGSPAYLWTLADSRERILKQAREAFGAGSSLALIEEVVAGEATFESAFCRVLAALLGQENPMLFVVPRLSALRRRQIPILRRDLQAHQAASEAIDQAGQRMVNAGYASLLHRPSTLLNSFYLKDERRLRLERRNDGIEAQDPVTHRPVINFEPDQIESEMQEHPYRFSPNVVTRPLLQDSGLPCIAYVAGPGEIQYLSQMRPVYPLYDVEAPAVLLRTSVTILDAQSICWLNARGISIKPGLIAASDLEAAIEARQEIPLAMLQEIVALEAETAYRISELARISGPEDRHVNVAIKKTHGSLQRSLDKLRQRLARQSPGNDPDSSRRIFNLLVPKGKAQERLLSPLNFTGDSPGSLARKLCITCDYTSMQSQIVPL